MRLLSAQLSVPDEKYGRKYDHHKCYDTGQQQNEPRFSDELFDFVVVDNRIIEFTKQNEI